MADWAGTGTSFSDFIVGLQGIFGNTTSGSGSSIGEQTVTGKKTTDQSQTDIASTILEAITKSLMSGTSKKGTQYTDIMLPLLFQAIDKQGTAFSKEAAIADSAGAADAKVKELINGELGNIFKASTMSGASESSGTAINTERLLARAGAASASVQQAAISDYTNKRLAAVQQMASILAMIQEGTTTTEQTQSQQNTSKQLSEALKKLLAIEDVQSKTTSKQNSTQEQDSGGLLDSLFG
jgi:hypothetical protein